MISIKEIPDCKIELYSPTFYAKVFVHSEIVCEGKFNGLGKNDIANTTTVYFLNDRIAKGNEFNGINTIRTRSENVKFIDLQAESYLKRKRYEISKRKLENS